jgi:hypothetical protein
LRLLNLIIIGGLFWREVTTALSTTLIRLAFARLLNIFVLIDFRGTLLFALFNVSAIVLRIRAVQNAIFIFIEIVTTP